MPNDVGNAQVNVSADTSGFISAMGGAVTALLGFNSSIADLAIGVAAGTVGLQLIEGALSDIGGFIKDSITNFENLQTAVVGLQEAADHQNISWGDMSQVLSGDVSKALSDTTFSAVDVTNALTKLTDVGLDATQTQQALNAAEDAAAGTGESLATAIQSITSAADGYLPRGRSLLLDKTDLTDATNKEMDVVQQLDDLYSGDAAEASDTLSGKLQELNNSWVMLQVELAEYVIPVIEDVVSWFQQLLSSVVDMNDVFANIGVDAAGNLQTLGDTQNNYNTTVDASTSKVYDFATSLDDLVSKHEDAMAKMEQQVSDLTAAYVQASADRAATFDDSVASAVTSKQTELNNLQEQLKEETENGSNIDLQKISDTKAKIAIDQEYMQKHAALISTPGVQADLGMDDIDKLTLKYNQEQKVADDAQATKLQSIKDAQVLEQQTYDDNLDKLGIKYKAEWTEIADWIKTDGTKQQQDAYDDMIKQVQADPLYQEFYGPNSIFGAGGVAGGAGGGAGGGGGKGTGVKSTAPGYNTSNALYDTLPTAGNLQQNLSAMIAQGTAFLMTDVGNTFKDALDAATGSKSTGGDLLKTLIEAVSGGATNLTDDTKYLKGSKAGGGFISETGPYMLHQGETVVPKGAATGGGVSVNFYGNMGFNSQSDMDTLVKKIRDVMTNDLRLAKNGIY